MSILYSATKTIIFDYCINAFFNKLQKNLKLKPDVNNMHDESILVLLESNITPYINFVSDYYDGLINEDTIQSYFHDYKNMRYLTLEQLDLFLIIISDYLENSGDYVYDAEASGEFEDGEDDSVGG